MVEALGRGDTVVSSFARGEGARIDWVGVSARGVGGPGGAPSRVEGRRRVDGTPVEGGYEVGPLQVSIVLERQGASATLHPSLKSVGPGPCFVESIVLGFRFGTRLEGAGSSGNAPLRYLRHGWQSWSLSESRALDASGEPPFPSGPWLRGMHHSQGDRDPAREGWHESEVVMVVGGVLGGDSALVGALEKGHASCVVYARPEAEGALIEAELHLEVPVEPGEGIELDPLRVAVDADASRLLERFATLWGRRAAARTAAAFQSGWCSWYHFFHAVTQEDLFRNVDALARLRDEGALELGVVQLDDGYQHALGDWLECNEKFPDGLAVAARRIRDAGFEAGIWLAPFAVSEESRTHLDHPDWTLRSAEGPLRGTFNPEWSHSGWCYVLDPSRPEVCAHLRATAAGLAGMGFDYLKLDFLYMAAMRAEAFDARLTRAARLRRGLEAIREGAGDQRFLLGCGAPIGPAVGLVDGMRIGPDVAPSWPVRADPIIPGLEPALPSTLSALRAILSRSFMHRRLWLNDPDCLMVRREQTDLSPAESESLAAGIAATGGMVVMSDDVPLLGQEDLGLARRTLELAREVDALGGWGSARELAPLSPGALAEGVRLLLSDGGTRVLLTALNLSDRSAPCELPLADLGLLEEPDEIASVGLGGGHGISHRLEAGRVLFALPAHASVCLRVEGARRLAVFCDFDGTFSVQDVGSTLALRFLDERRSQLWAEYERGEVDAWHYALRLFEGFSLPTAELDAFLETIEIDPGARGLLSFCEARGVPFEILSDGFDYNLERLQSMFGVSFRYLANHLDPSGRGWRLTPGARNPLCHCGTGSCKRGRIERFRQERPGHFVVHIGNGRVSDLCGAMTADLVFAKDTLAPALEERGVAHMAFETLDDVTTALEPLAPPVPQR